MFYNGHAHPQKMNTHTQVYCTLHNICGQQCSWLCHGLRRQRIAIHIRISKRVAVTCFSGCIAARSAQTANGTINVNGNASSDSNDAAIVALC